MSTRDRHARQLERAGYEYAEGWFPKAFAQRVRQQAEAHRAEVERIRSEPPNPKGWPKGKPRK